MTPHFSPDDQTAALDGTLDADRLAHLSSCASCRDELARTRSILDAMRSDDVPEPSPLFWEHFSNRVRAATSAEAAAPSPRFGWRGWATMASALVAFVMVLIFRHLPAEPARLATPPQQIEAVASTVSPAESADTEPLAAVMQMASSLSSEDLRSVVSAAGEETLLVEDLSPAERAAFVRLLHAEMEKVQ